MKRAKRATSTVLQHESPVNQIHKHLEQILDAMAQLVDLLRDFANERKSALLTGWALQASALAHEIWQLAEEVAAFAATDIPDGSRTV